MNTCDIVGLFSKHACRVLIPASIHMFVIIQVSHTQRRRVRAHTHVYIRVFEHVYAHHTKHRVEFCSDEGGPHAQYWYEEYFCA